MNFKSNVYRLIASASVDAANLFDISYVDINNQDLSLNIAAVNTFWRTQLALLPQDTMYARMSLNDRCTVQQWSQLFFRDVVPVIVQYWLPAKLMERAVSHA